MVNKIEKYSYRVMWSEEDDEFIGLCAEFSGLNWPASTSGKALKGIQTAVKECISDMSKNNEKLPMEISARSFSGVFMVRLLPEVPRYLA